MKVSDDDPRRWVQVRQGHLQVGEAQGQVLHVVAVDRFGVTPQRATPTAVVVLEPR